MGVYVPVSSLKRLKEYKYSAEDHSPISKYILKPFWRRFTLLFPTYVAPNLITLTGGLFVVINLATLLYYNPWMNQSLPSWIYYSWALGLFLYQTFDACDGSQARRTGQSGPLGELFDHGVDALNTTFGSVLFCGATRLGLGWRSLIIQFFTLMNFYLCTWEEYHTGTLYLSMFSGPVEGILMIIGIYILTGIYGPEIWSYPIKYVLEKFSIPFSQQLPKVVTHLSLVDAYLFAGALALLFNVQVSFVNVLKKTKIGVIKHETSAWQALSSAVPFFVFYGGILGFTIENQGDLFSSPSIFWPFIASIGLQFAYTVGLIITAHLTKQTFPFVNVLILTPVGMFFIKHWFPLIETSSLVWASFGLSFGIYGSFVMDVIEDFCDYLDIGCLRIKPKTGSAKKNN